MWSHSIAALVHELVAIPSITQTAGEAAIEHHLLERLGTEPYFRRHPDRFGRHAIPRDPLERAAVWALVRGTTDDTVVLVNHHDTVGVGDFGPLAEHAVAPRELMARLPETRLSPAAAADLAGGEWLFGRGAADMKGGAAIQLALVQALSRRPPSAGNVLFLSVPGEETISLGMLNSVGLLERLAVQHGLAYRLMIDSEPHVRGPDGHAVVHTGSAGKLLAVVYVRGRMAHVGNVFAGLNPLLVLSEIIRQTELSPAFADTGGGQAAPPPTWMFAGDRQETYEGSLPHAASGCLSVISLARSPGEVMERLLVCVRDACRRIPAVIDDRYRAHAASYTGTERNPAGEIAVTSFADLFETAVREGGPVFETTYRRTLADVHERIDRERTSMIEGSAELIEAVLSHVAARGPVAVVGFAPPYYPAMSNSRLPDTTRPAAVLSGAIDSLSRRRWDVPVEEQSYFMQIADMSFASFHDTTDARRVLGGNMPLWERFYGDIFRPETTLSMPVINIGPWGKDLHTFTERVYLPDLLHRTPAIIAHTLEEVFAAR